MSALAVDAGTADRELDDLDLVAAVRAGDDRAFEVLFLRYQPRIAAYVGGMVRDHGRAEDITQEVFMSALRCLREGDRREILFRPWIYEIAKNKCIDAYRRGRNTVEVSFDAHDQVGAADHGRLAEPSPTPDAAVEGKLAFDNLRGALGGLSPVHHEILVMREFEGLSYREIGERLGMSRPAVESTLFRARKRLGEEYEELISGKRCLRVQRIVDDCSAGAAGLRDQRRVARHLAHCQPCRRHAHLAGADVQGLVRPAASAGARIAAFLPLPAFLRRRWGANEPGAHILSQQAARPGAQWSAQLAAVLDPGVVSSWAKVAATAATVALAGIGGAAIEHRGSADRPDAAAPGASSPAAGDPANASPRSAAGTPLSGGVDANAARSGTSPTDGTQSASGPGGGPGSPAAADQASKQGAAAPTGDRLRELGSLPSAPDAPGDGADGVGSVVDRSAPTLELPRSAGADAPAGALPRPDRVLGDDAPRTDGAAGITDGVGRDVVPDRGADLPPVAAPPTGDLPATGIGDNVRPPVPDVPKTRDLPRLGG